MSDDLIVLRPITENDTEDIIRWRNSSSVKANFIYRTEITAEEHLRWYNERVLTKQVAQFIIVESKTGIAVGSVYLRDVDGVNKKAEFGIFIGEDSARGKGYGTIATRKIIEHAFNELGLNKVFLRVLYDNSVAINCYEKVGFQQEGLFREDVIIDGKPCDILFMGLLKSEWEEGFV